MLCPFCGEWLSGVRVRTLDPGRSLSELDSEGRHIKGDKPTKEAVLHTTMYARRRDAEAIVHLH
jgi:ribulose-5-phosphate 4-epimerase/fuculose-1-phosphate aldolase